METPNEKLRVGGDIDAYCTRCKMDLQHTIEAIDAEGQIARVHCNTCGSQHNYHRARSEYQKTTVPPPSQVPSPGFSAGVRKAAPPPVAQPTASDTGTLRAIKAAIREVLGEEFGLGTVEMGDRWVGGQVVIQPGRAGLQEKTIPIDNLFHKIVMIRDRLRILEQRINTHPKLTSEDKVGMQQYITACYGSLTTFNFLFRSREDGFAGSKDTSSQET